MRKIIVIILIISSKFISAQTGIFYYDASDNIYPNTQIVDIKESKNGDIFLLGKSNDSAYQVTLPYFAHLTKDFKPVSQNKFPVQNIYEIRNLILLPDNNFKIFGTESSGGVFKPFTKTFDINGVSNTEESTLTTFATLFCNAKQLDVDNTIITQTVKGSSQKFNISLYQVENKNFNQIWYKKLKSDFNEEADKIYIADDKSIIVPAKKYDDYFSSYNSVVYKLSPSGEILWRNDISESDEKFVMQAVVTDKDGKIMLMNSIQNQLAGTCQTKIMTIADDGKTTSVKKIDSIVAKGMLRLSNGNILLFGSAVISSGSYVITKAKIVMLDKSLNIVYQRVMDFLDEPDAELPSLAMTALPTSSDLLTAEILSDGRIACAGRVFMPKERDAEKILFSPRINNPFIIVLDKNGRLP